MSVITSQVRQHTARDLQAYGRRYGLDYRTPDLSPRAEAPVVRGVVREFAPRPGMQLVASDVEVLHRYESYSRAASPLSIVVMLEGRADVSLAHRTLTLTAGMALSLRLEADCGLAASQPAGQRLRALTLSLDDACLARLGMSAPAPAASHLRAWQLPEPLRQGLEQELTTPLPGEAQRLLLEGLSLQLLAHGGRVDDPTPSPAPTLSPQERQRLERVRAALHDQPAGEHRLTTLAELAAMSPASLRRKFRAAYGHSVFDYLRECRLALAHDYLEQGFSVQQAAHFCGYRHASNFATAFRRRFGYPPSSLHETS
ncbi:helix-turn-helix transcriptional regulator [Halomonas marinisediminis]|uniref:Helix-turn-helix domain-containing protein n=1 Tax=Halomonas marinisediminis TaxID=2546095 RepID=A0ABY2D5D3_9GAMM|nr:helix-turn-helix transcriptional regulator [Halomonas marinisediminis]TDB01853.1 helix-turn-helix domain-containing protein [Halomonas marinisediminis]